jgi:hypothetical protein
MGVGRRISHDARNPVIEPVVPIHDPADRTLVAEVFFCGIFGYNHSEGDFQRRIGIPFNQFIIKNVKKRLAHIKNPIFKKEFVLVLERPFYGHSNTHFLLDFGKFGDQCRPQWRSAVRQLLCRSLGSVLRDKPINAIRAVIETVIGGFVPDIGKYQNAAGYSERQAKNVDQRIGLVFDDISESDL